MRFFRKEREKSFFEKRAKVKRSKSKDQSQKIKVKRSKSKDQSQKIKVKRSKSKDQSQKIKVKSIFLMRACAFFAKNAKKAFLKSAPKSKEENQSQNPGGRIPQALSFFLIVIASLAGF
ncbi:MAG: hypothetical protein HQL99_15435 [Magnetococcales bacterium]|nr:hypothetical protein [Magnetococcales bacterium]